MTPCDAKVQVRQTAQPRERRPQGRRAAVAEGVAPAAGRGAGCHRGWEGEGEWGMRILRLLPRAGEPMCPSLRALVAEAVYARLGMSSNPHFLSPKNGLVIYPRTSLPAFQSSVDGPGRASESPQL